MTKSVLPFSNPTISRLIDSARNGSPHAAGELLEACRGYLLLIANRHLNDKVRPKVGGSDLVQETFVRAAQAFPRFQGRSERELLAWLQRILVNRIIETHRGFRADRRDIDREHALLVDDASRPVGPAAVCPRESPSRQVVALEQAQHLEAAIVRLPPHYAEIIRLRSRELLGFHDIGLRMGLGADAARKLWARAIERLQTELGERDNA